jgi:biopolymer transport protein TolR
MAFNFNRSRKEPMSEINVTPFVDVMLVLLIIFMVTAPLLTVGGSRSTYQSPQQTHFQTIKKPLTLSINSKGEIYIQEHQVTYQKMIPKLLAIAKNRTDTRIYVRGDKILIMEES